MQHLDRACRIPRGCPDLNVDSVSVIGGEDDLFVANFGHGSRGPIRALAPKSRMSNIPSFSSSNDQQACLPRITAVCSLAAVYRLFCALATISLKRGSSRIGSRSVSFSSQISQPGEALSMTSESRSRAIPNSFRDT